MRWLLIFLFGIAATFTAFASEVECKNEEPIPKSIEQMISESEYIGFYKAKTVTILEGEYSCCRFKQQLFNANFERLSVLKGNAPKFLERKTTFPDPNVVPISYFRIDTNHEKLVNSQDILFLWSDTTSSYSMRNGLCFYAPYIVPGYEYLVFGGVRSPISVEPILDQRTDALYNRVVDTLRSQDHN